MMLYITAIMEIIDIAANDVIASVIGVILMQIIVADLQQLCFVAAFTIYTTYIFCVILYILTVVTDNV